MSNKKHIASDIMFILLIAAVTSIVALQLYRAVTATHIVEVNCPSFTKMGIKKGSLITFNDGTKTDTNYLAGACTIIFVDPE